jgi:hypothetical protein
MATLRVRVGRMLSSLAVLLAATGSSPADVLEAPLEMRDIEITVYVRRALMQDPDVSKLGLGVTVLYNQATVSGDVPSRELAERVLRIVESVKGVYQVKDAMRVVQDDAEKVTRDLAAGLGAGLFDVELFSSLELPQPTTGPQTVTTAQPDPKAWEQPSAPVAVLLPPVPVAEETPAPTRTPAITLSSPREEERVDLATLIERLRFAEERYHDLRVEVSAGRVTLSGRVANAEHLMELGRALSQLPGVRNVDLRGVQVGR